MSKIIKVDGCMGLANPGLQARPWAVEAGSTLPPVISPFAPLVDAPAGEAGTRVGANSGKIGAASRPPFGPSTTDPRQRAEDEARTLRQDAENVLGDARKRAAEIESEAYAQGFDQGRKDGEELGRRQYEATAQRLEQLVSQLGIEARGLWRKCEAQMVRLALAVGQHLVHRELRAEPAIVAECVWVAMKCVVEGSRIRLHLCPQDAELLAERLSAGMDSVGGHSMEVIPDGQISRGGCLIETDFGLVDGTIETRWQGIVDAIEQTLNQRTGVANEYAATMRAAWSEAENIESDPFVRRDGGITP